MQAKVRRRLFPSRPTIRQGVVPNHQERELLQAEGLVIGAAGAVQAKDRLCGSTVLGGVAAASQPLMLTPSRLWSQRQEVAWLPRLGVFPLH